ncbi:MAG TPA: hypothetical protein VN734_11690 [Acidobacteriaceae bacterium]|nr:hypothetical protein [Acidobacteriaceae bacterium]
MLSRSSVYGCDASGFGTPGCAGNPEAMDSVALPSTCCGVDIVAGSAVCVDDATIAPAVPPLEGIVLLAVSTSSSQLCSMGANVKSPFAPCPAMTRLWTWYRPVAPGSSERSCRSARVSG